MYSSTTNRASHDHIRYYLRCAIQNEVALHGKQAVTGNSVAGRLHALHEIANEVHRYCAVVHNELLLSHSACRTIVWCTSIFPIKVPTTTQSTFFPTASCLRRAAAKESQYALYCQSNPELATAIRAARAGVLEHRYQTTERVVITNSSRCEVSEEILYCSSDVLKTRPCLPSPDRLRAREAELCLQSFFRCGAIASKFLRCFNLYRGGNAARIAQVASAGVGWCSGWPGAGRTSMGIASACAFSRRIPSNPLLCGSLSSSRRNRAQQQYVRLCRPAKDGACVLV